LRLHEIPLYLDSRSTVYRPLAELLIGSGLRISGRSLCSSETWNSKTPAGVIVVYRSGKKGKVGSTKSDRFRSVEIGPGFSEVVREQVELRAGMPGDDKLDTLLYAMPVGAQDRPRALGGDGNGKPLDRTTVSRDWRPRIGRAERRQDRRGSSHASVRAPSCRAAASPQRRSQRCSDGAL
jgi:hypothetical protein